MDGQRQHLVEEFCEFVRNGHRIEKTVWPRHLKHDRSTARVHGSGVIRDGHLIALWAARRPLSGRPKAKMRADVTKTSVAVVRVIGYITLPVIPRRRA